ncbi:anti-repressor SinI family protein [Domibacillus sp. DTU_2020_1001157_1_SI_ALB_TIR_016]|uniref:anti-repressor SinI family protein n=1 Tax=Domibacillus sp. DTU_2020_1001157_1_SI_ALB_TIR_016 TaxID=3077789 RepID=UPI0028E38E85|nr:anti-repressor SinI family protein [Domibacillus sp. DTU_2020_1001157_1_SI_ALB_TIR_016]WNS78193.1 anti-repressor SinI family protein [Domibacillus sp. DTU_2020_1001157_1_SI_ALB_TIR_016]
MLDQDLDQGIVEEVLDTEWIALMKAAKSLGLSIEEIKEFLAANTVKNSAS